MDKKYEKEELKRYVSDKIDANEFCKSGTASTSLMLRLGENAEEINRELKANAERGKPFREAPYKQKENILTYIIEKTYSSLKPYEEPTWKDVLRALPTDGNPIQEIDEEEEKIHYRTKQPKEKKITFATFRNKLTKIKKQHSNLVVSPTSST